MGRNKIVKNSGASRLTAKQVYRTILKRLKGRVAIVGVGNTDKGDDGAGPFFIQQLKNVVAESRPSGRGSAELALRKKWTVPILIDAGIAPENWLEPIAREKPDTIVVVDAADFGGKPGEIRIFEIEDISKIGFTTHALAPSVFMKYLKNETNADIFLLAIQPKRIEMNPKLSQEVKSSIKKLVSEFCR